MSSVASLPITVLIQTKNEEESIAACIKSVSAFDEVITVDSDSSDRTTEIATELGSRVVPFTWNGLYPKKKQWQLDNVETRNEWVLFLDADERITANLVAELHERFASGAPSAAAFDVRLSYTFAGRTLRHGHQVSKRILVDRGRAVFMPLGDIDSEGMGELEGHYQPVIDGRIDTLRAKMVHMDLDPVRTWFERHNRYSDWEAFLRTHPEVRAKVAEMRSQQGRAFDAVPAKPAMFFLYAYLIRAGFLDGRAGFDYAIALSAYYWQIGLKVRESVRRVADSENS